MVPVIPPLKLCTWTGGKKQEGGRRGGRGRGITLRPFRSSRAVLATSGSMWEVGAETLRSVSRLKPPRLKPPKPPPIRSPAKGGVPSYLTSLDHPLPISYCAFFWLTLTLPRASARRNAALPDLLQPRVTWRGGPGIELLRCARGCGAERARGGAAGRGHGSDRGDGDVGCRPCARGRRRRGGHRRRWLRRRATCCRR